MKIKKKTLLSIFFIIATLVSLVAISSISASAQYTGSVLKLGDVDMDGEISIKDATLIQMYVTKYQNFTRHQMKLADCDDKEGVQISDATYLQIFIAKMNAEFPKNTDGYKLSDYVIFKSYNLIKGEEFNNVIKEINVNNSVKEIIIDSWYFYNTQFNWADGTPVDNMNKGTIRLFTNRDKSKVYVLSKENIWANSDSKSMFKELESVEYIKFNNFNTAYVKDMSFMFFECTNLKELDLSGFNTSRVTTMDRMFQCCNSITKLDVSSFDTSLVIDMYGMFSN